MKCPECQWDNPQERAFCFKCGGFLFVADTGLHLATIGSRVWATILDFILFIVTLVIGYIIWFIISAQRGQTPGKQLATIACVNKEGERLHFWRMVWREIISQYLIAIVTVSIVGWLDYLWALWDKDRQTWHDKMASSWVVQAV